MKKVDIVVSCYNEEKNIECFYNEVLKYIKNMNYSFNIIFVDDGSTDKTFENIMKLISNINRISEKKKVEVSVISFIRNYGHEVAMCAGLDFSTADYIIFIDVDLQNPPNKIPEIIKCFENGADCVLMKRKGYICDNILKKITSKLYYFIYRLLFSDSIEADVSDFFAINKNVAERVRENYKTRVRFLRGYIQTESKNKQVLYYEHNKRKNGKTHYNYLMLSKLAIVSVFSRSKLIRDLFSAKKSIYQLRNL